MGKIKPKTRRMKVKIIRGKREKILKLKKQLTDAKLKNEKNAILEKIRKVAPFSSLLK